MGGNLATGWLRLGIKSGGRGSVWRSGADGGGGEGGIRGEAEKMEGECRDGEEDEGADGLAVGEDAAEDDNRGVSDEDGGLATKMEGKATRASTALNQSGKGPERRKPEKRLSGKEPMKELKLRTREKGGGEGRCLMVSREETPGAVEVWRPHEDARGGGGFPVHSSLFFCPFTNLDRVGGFELVSRGSAVNRWEAARATEKRGRWSSLFDFKGGS